MKTRDISQGITGVGVSRVGGKKKIFKKRNERRIRYPIIMIISEKYIYKVVKKTGHDARAHTHTHNHDTERDKAHTHTHTHTINE